MVQDPSISSCFYLLPALCCIYLNRPPPSENVVCFTYGPFVVVKEKGAVVIVRLYKLQVSMTLTVLASWLISSYCWLIVVSANKKLHSQKHSSHTGHVISDPLSCRRWKVYVGILVEVISRTLWNFCGDYKTGGSHGSKLCSVIGRW